ncbi:thiol-disulfide oxidoreductase DCC family protein [Undibacterium sp. Ren11W]|uniref:thiol-disulfide oxidoreductase DCC family protein n=1 Tax=Undibacterium sp. Ren11W TaxID=3413045 RepID=UPI003BF38AE6
MKIPEISKSNDCTGEPQARPQLTLFYDGNCPFCDAEMRRLRGWNRAGRLHFVDIAEADFDPAALGVSMQALNLELHSQTAAGDLLVGIDSMLAAYTLVGRGWLVAALRIQFLRPSLANLYRKFARNRYRISRWLGYQKQPAQTHCVEGVCQVGNPFLRDQA